MFLLLSRLYGDRGVTSIPRYSKNFPRFQKILLRVLSILFSVRLGESFLQDFQLKRPFNELHKIPCKSVNVVLSIIKRMSTFRLLDL